MCELMGKLMGVDAAWWEDGARVQARRPIVRGELLPFPGGAVGALFAAFSFAISVFAMPMLIEEETDAMSALGISMAIVWNNLRVMLAWGAIVLALFLVCVVTLGVGLVVVFPVLGHGTWRAYRALRGSDRQGRQSERMFIRPA